MDNPQDCLVTSSQDVIKNNFPSTSGHSVSVYKNGRKKKNKSGTDQFPWFIGFQKLSRSVLGSNSMKDLLNVMNVYTEHVSSDVLTSYSKPNRAAKLKTNMTSTLAFFHNCYVTMKEPFDEATYLEKMSNLLTMYFDMEVKASRRGKESVKKIISKLISALFIFLNNSSEYILDTILKARFTVKSYSEICIPIFKMVTNLPQSQEMNYVRSLLVFKLWKRMLPCREERNSINRLAVAKLSPPPAQVMEFIKRGLLASVLPTPPEDKKAALLTRFYMTKKFNLRDSIKAFLKLEVDLKLNDFTSVLDSIKFLDDDEDVVAEENSFEKDYSLLEKIWVDISNSPESSEPSPSTSACSPLDVSCSGASRMLELSKTPSRKVKKSLFKPKSPKKNKRPKTKSKEKTKKKEVDMVIDLCKDCEDDCTDVSQNFSKTSKLQSTTASQVCDQDSRTSAIGTTVKSSNSVFSKNNQEVNSSNDLKFSRKLIEKSSKLSEKDFVKCNNVDLETKIVKTHLQSEASSSKSLGGISKPQVGDIISSATTVNDFSTNTLLEATIAPQSIAEVEQNECLKSKCKQFEKTKEKGILEGILDQESKVKPESIVISKCKQFVEPQDKGILDQESRVKPENIVISKCKQLVETQDKGIFDQESRVKPESNVISKCKQLVEIQDKGIIDQESRAKPESINDHKEGKKNEIKDLMLTSDIKKTESEDNSDVVTGSIEMTEELPPANRIVISCKNFSKIGFRHEEDENAAHIISNEPGELISTEIEVSEDPILKMESFKEDSLFFKEDDVSSENSSDKLKQGLDAGKLSWDHRLKDSPEANLSDPKLTHSTEVMGLTGNVCNNDFSDTRFDSNSTTSHSPKTNSFEEFFHNEKPSIDEEEPNKLSEEGNRNIRLNTDFSQNLKSDSFGDLFPNEEVNLGKKETNKQLKSGNFDDLLPTEEMDLGKKETNEQFGEPTTQDLLEIQMLWEDNLINRFAGQVNHMQNFQETKGSRDISVLDHKIENDRQNMKDVVNPSSVTPKVHPSIIEMVDSKSGTKIIHKSITTIINNLKEGESSTSSENSNQESSEVSSSSFEDSYPINIYSTPIIKVNPSQESMPCKIEKEHFKDFSACMQNSQSTLVKSQISEKCDKNIQVPSEKPLFIDKESDFITSSQSSEIPKNSLNKHAFKLHKGLNTCLLHKILGEEDCLKSGCLLKSSATEKNLQGQNERGFPNVSLKQELENSSDLPPEKSTPTISSLWNPVAGIKVENDSSRSSECVEGIRNTSSEFLIRSVTEACNFKELDYNIGNECDNLMSNYDFESDCDDRNLVIDEDIESIKDQNEMEDIQLRNGSDRVQNVTNNNIVSPFILTKSKLSNKGDDQLWTIKGTHEIHNVTMEHHEHQSSNNVNSGRTKENKSTTTELAGKHKLPKIIESNIKTSTPRNSYVNETSDSNVKCRRRTSSEELYLVENSVPYNAAQNNKEKPRNSVPKQYTQSKIIKMSDESTNAGQKSPNQRVFSPYPMPHANLKVIRTKNRDPRLGPVCTDNNTYRLKPNVNVQSNVNSLSTQIKQLESVSLMNQPVCQSTSNIAKVALSRPAPSPSHYETYSQYNVCNKMSITSNQSNSSQVERYGQRSPMGNEKYLNLENIRQKRESPNGLFQENANITHTNLRTYAEGSNLKDNSNQSFHKHSGTESQNMKAVESLYDNINSIRDPLCLVKNKEDLRESYDFEFNVFPIAQEIEVYSGSENLSGEWPYPVTSEIGHPDWPIANEQNVIDSSSYTQTPEQYMYSLLKSDEAVIPEAEQPCYMSFELQQIDNTRPGNISGKDINKEQLNLHLRTLDGDYNLCCSQSKFKELQDKVAIVPTIPVPLPRSQSDNTMRCPCEQCSDNHKKLLSNYDTLTLYRNLKIKPSGLTLKSDELCFSEKDQNGEFDSSLPLKKRRTNSQVNKLTSSKANDDLVLPSYPNTPMISIAQLELTGYEQSNQVIVPNPQSQWRESVAYNPLNLVQPPPMESLEGQGKGKRRASKRRKSCR